jgi:hypothetical protein
MAATTNRATWIQMRNHLKAMGGVADAVIGEPKSVMSAGTVAIIPSDGSVDETVLNAPREVHSLTLRRFENAMQEPLEDTEFKLDAWRANIAEDFFGDFTLGGTMAYALPTAFNWQYGYVTYNSTMYRFLDINIGYRVDDRSTFAP